MKREYENRNLSLVLFYFLARLFCSYLSIYKGTTSMFQSKYKNSSRFIYYTLQLFMIFLLIYISFYSTSCHYTLFTFYFIHLYYLFIVQLLRVSNLTWHLTRYVRTCDTSFPHPTTAIAYSSSPHSADHLHLAPHPFAILSARSVRFSSWCAAVEASVRAERTRSRLVSSKSRVMRAL